MDNLKQLFDTIDVGILVLDKDYRIHAWNQWMADRSGIPERDAKDQNIFVLFPNLDSTWFKRDCLFVFNFGSFAFISHKTHPYCFPFDPVSAFQTDLTKMHQDCTISPLRNAAGEITHISITVKDVTQVALYEKRLIYLSETDGLTEIKNRKYLDTLLEQEFERYKRYGRDLCLIMLDIDFFKKINDTWGHPCGDSVLKQLAAVLKGRVRAPDTLVRYGGEEFAILLPETTGKDAFVFAESIRLLIENEKFKYKDNSIAVTVSLGVASVSSDVDDITGFIECADSALYKAKATGRNKVVSH